MHAGSTCAVEPLSAHERKILTLLAKGIAPKLMVALSGISLSASEIHRNHMMVKLDIYDRDGLVQYARQNGLQTR